MLLYTFVSFPFEPCQMHQLSQLLLEPQGTGNLNDVNADPSLDFPSTDDGLNKKIANNISFTKNGITEKSVIKESFPGFFTEVRTISLS